MNATKTKTTFPTPIDVAAEMRGPMSLASRRLREKAPPLPQRKPCRARPIKMIWGGSGLAYRGEAHRRDSPPRFVPARAVQEAGSTSRCRNQSTVRHTVSRRRT